MRKELGLRRPPHSRRLPRILPEASLKKFYEVIDQAGDLQHQIMLRLLFYTAVRVSELTAIKVEDVDLDACKIFIELGKGDKDRYILFMANSSSCSIGVWYKPRQCFCQR